MSSKRRLRRRSCEGKKRYPRNKVGLAQAHNAIKYYYNKGTNPKKSLIVYKCRFCKHYHIGNNYHNKRFI